MRSTSTLHYRNLGLFGAIFPAIAVGWVGQAPGERCWLRLWPGNGAGLGSAYAAWGADGKGL